MSPDEVRALILALPAVEEGSSYGMPAFKLAGKFLTRLRAEDQSLVLTGVHADERDLLIEAEPAVFHVTDHYRGYPTVLARIATVDPAQLAALLQRRWRELAPRKLLKLHAADLAADRPSPQSTHTP